MSTLIRGYPGDRGLDFLLVVILGVALASSTAWLISRRLAGKAVLRHLVLFSALICCLAFPALASFCAATGLTLVSFPILRGEQERITSGVPQIETDPAGMPPRQSTDPPPVGVELPLPNASTSPHSNTTIDPSRVAPAANQIPAISTPSQSDVPHTGSPAATLVSFRGIATGVMFVWAAGALLMLARLAANCGRVVLLRRSSRPLQNESHQVLLQEIAANLGTRQVPLLLVSSRTVTPLAVGIGRPAVILPERLLGAVSDNELRDVLVHEVAHLQRGDQRIVLLQELAGALYWPIVSVHGLNHELRRAREELCDNVVLAGRNAISYGETLLHIAELSVNARPMRAAVGIVGGQGELERRVAGLISPGRNTMTAAGRKASYFVLFLFLAVGALLSATRFVSSASPERDDPRTGTKPPAGSERSDPKPADKTLSEEEKLELAAIQSGLRNRRLDTSSGYEDLIGALVENAWWSNSLPLAPAQARAIKKLDELIRDARDHAARALADSLDTNPSDYKALIASRGRRLHESLRHGQRMVALGLLTEPQAAFVLYHYTSGGNNLYVLRDKNVQELLGMAAIQNQELDKVGEAATRREAQLNLWTVEPIEQEYVGTVMAANQKRMNAEALNVLTPSQRKIWDGFTAKRSLPAKAPEMPVLSEAEAARIEVEKVSPVFRVLSEKADAIKLSDPQKKLLKRLEEITRDGLHWISLRKSEDAAPTAADQVSKASVAFVRQAEQIALFGILTEKQAKQVESANK